MYQIPPYEQRDKLLDFMSAGQKPILPETFAGHYAVILHNSPGQVPIESLEEDDCPGGLEHALQALWYDANGDWNRAHEIVQQMGDVTAARIHAYLHREEGEEWNSRYWHRRAGSTFPEGVSLEEEWDSLARSLTGFSD